MDFADRIKDVATRSRNASKNAMTEEATKTSVILPFIQALGYDVFNLDEVVPEYIADQGIKKGEKVDFLVKNGGKEAILVEAKPISTKLSEAQYSQLYRYFSVCEARLAILTNGREIWFFSDTDERNKMDKRPFFVFDLQAYDEKQVKELARFQKSEFALDAILEAASNMKFVKSAANFLKNQLSKPDDDFVRFLGKSIYDGTLTKSVVEQLRPAIQAALDEVIRERIQDRLNVAFRPEPPQPESAPAKKEDEVAEGGEIVTTNDELQAFMIVRAIGAKIVPLSRLTIRDAKSYCSVFVDDTNRKPVCRLFFNSPNKRSIVIFGDNREEYRFDIEDVADLYQHQDLIEAAIARYK